MIDSDYHNIISNSFNGLEVGEGSPECLLFHMKYQL